MKSTPHPVRPTCPQCRSALMRTPRSFIDRVISLMVPVRRYHCTGGGCGWHGLIRRPSAYPVDGVWDSPALRDQVLAGSRWAPGRAVTAGARAATERRPTQQLWGSGVGMTPDGRSTNADRYG